MQDTPSAARMVRVAFAALLCVIVIYLFLVWPALRGPFLFDDFPNLSGLSRLTGDHTWRELGIFLSDGRGFPGRPLSMLSFALQGSAWPDNPFPFKLANLGLHVANAGLLFLLLQTLARLSPTTSGMARIVAAVAAVAWLIHPIQISTVMLVVQRMTLLSTMVMLLGLIAYLRGVTRNDLPEKTRAIWMILGLVGGSAIAVFCKENGVLLPVFAWVIDSTLLRTETATLPVLLRRVRRLVLYPSLAVLAIYLLSWLRDATAILPIRDFTIAERLLTEPRVLFDYVGNIVLPRYSQFGIFHDDFQASRSLLAPATTLPAMIALVGLLAVAIWQRKTKPLLAFAILWFAGGHVLEAGPVPLELYFEHRNYLPLAGPIFAVVAALASLPAGNAKRLGATVFGVWILVCLFATALYASVWSSREKVNYFWAQSHPASVRAQTGYAELLFEGGNLPAALDVLERASKVRPDDVGLDLAAAMVGCQLGSLDAAALSALHAKLREARFSRFAYETMASLQSQAAAEVCPAMDEVAWQGLSDTLLANAAYQGDASAMGNLHYQRHSMAVARGDLAGALAELDEVQRYDPNPDIPRMKAKYLADAGLLDQAIAVLRDYDPSTRAQLRTWLVDDVAINREAIAELRKREALPSPEGSAGARQP